MITPTIDNHDVVRTSCDALILIVLHEEWQAFLEAFPEAHANDTTDVILDGLSAAILEFPFEGYQVVAALLNQSPISKNQTMGKVPAAVFATCMLRKYAPALLVNIGIACRINKADVQLGDVVIATDLIDVTGNCAVEDVKRGAMPKFRPGKPNISCAGKVLDDIVALRRSHPDEFNKWRNKGAEELRSIDSPVSEFLLGSGMIATGDPLSKSGAFHEIVKDSNRKTTAYEMEAFAIAEAAQMLRNKAALLILKGLSDDGDGKKGEIEAKTKGALRTISMRNAARLLRTAMKAGILPMSTHTFTEDVLSGKSQSTATVPTVQGFPYFSVDELADFGSLRSHLLDDKGPLVDLFEAGQSYAPQLAQELHPSSSDELTIRFLNSIVDSDLWNRAGWKLPDSGDAHTVRLQKVWRDAYISDEPFREHQPQVVNRLIIEHELRRHVHGCLKRATPILTCLIENTGLHRALEDFKAGFQRRHRVVIDFDAVPLTDLYRISNEELISRTSSKYDLVFHYHLGAWRFYAADVVWSVPPERADALRPQLIPAVERECCSVVGHDTTHTIIPINANSMVLTINKDLFERYSKEFSQGPGSGEGLQAPRTWQQFKTILEFFDGKKEDKIYGIVPQGKRTGDSLYFEWCNFAYSFGGGVFSKDRGWAAWKTENVILDHKNTIDATVFYKAIYDRCPPDIAASDLDSKGQLKRFLQGDVAMAVMWTDLLSELYHSDGGQKYSTHVIPGSKSMVGGGVCLVHGASENRDLAQKFVDGLLDIDVQARLTVTGWCSAFRDVYLKPFVKELPYSAAVEASLSRACYMIEAGPSSDRVRDLVGINLEKIVKHGADPQEILKGAASILRRGL